MAMSQQKAEAIIEFIGRDNVTGLLDAIQKKTQKTGDEGEKAWDRTAKAIDRATARASVLSGSFTDIASKQNAALASAIKLGTTLVGIYEKSLATQVAIAEKGAIKATLERQLGKGAGAGLRDATGGELSGADERTLARAALAAKEAGLARTEIEKAVLAARQLADARGEDIGDTAGKVLQALTTGADKSLKRLGIVVDTGKAEAEYAAQLGRSVSQLSDAEKLTAKRKAMQEELQRVGSSEGNSPEARALAQARQSQQEWERTKLSVAGIARDVTMYYVHSWQEVKKSASETWQEIIGGGSASVGNTRATVQLMEQLRQYEEAQRKAAEQTRQTADATKAADKAAADYHATLLKQVATERDATRVEYERELQLSAAAREIGATREEIQHLQRAQDIYDTKLITATQRTENFTRALRDEAETFFKVSVALGSYNTLQAQTIEQFNQGEAAASAGGPTQDWSNENAAKKSKKPRTGGGGARPRGLALSGDTRENMLAFRDAVSAYEAQRGTDEAAVDAFIAKMDASRQSASDYAAGLAKDYQQWTSEADRGMERYNELVASAAGGTNQLTSAIQGLSAVSPQLGQVASVMADTIGQMSAIFKEGEKNGVSWGESFAKAAPMAISAIGQMGAAWAEDARTRYAILAVAEVAAAAASYPDYAGMAIHGLAAVTYGIAAGMAGGASSGASAPSGGGSRGRSQLPSGFGPGPSAQNQESAAITVHIHGGLWADDREAARKIEAVLGKHSRRAFA